MKSNVITRRNSESSINVLSKDNDKDNQKRLSKSSEAKTTVYERIEHQGLPRITTVGRASARQPFLRPDESGQINMQFVCGVAP